MIQSIYFLPHGMQIIPGMEDPYNTDFQNLHDKMTEIQINMEKEKSEYIVLITPHGLNLEDQFLTYDHNSFNGNYYKIEEDVSVVYGQFVTTKSWLGDEEFSNRFREYLNKNNIEVKGLTQGYADYPLALAWGETVPLYYLPKTNKSKIIILGIPRSRHEKIFEIQKTLSELGSLLVEFCHSEEKTVSIIFSGDLSHTHIESGPYGFHPSSKTFDNLVQEWSKQPNRETFSKILDLQPTALACGMAGISMLQGIADKHQLMNNASFYDLPTYFGMIINHWKLMV